MAAPPKTIAGPVPLQPRTPLGEPVVLWDTREWDGTTGLGTGGLANLGTGGSKFDLDVTQTTGGGRTETYATQFGGSWGGAGDVQWADYGGDACDAPFTFMVAVDDLDPSVSDGYFEVDILARKSGSGQLVVGIDSFAVVHEGDDSVSGTVIAVYLDDVGAGFDHPLANWYPYGDPGEGDLIRNRLLVMSSDMVNGGATFWRGDVAVPAGAGADEEFFLSSGSDPGDDAILARSCEVADGLTLGDHFFYLAGDERDGFVGVVAGDPWNDCRGAALFRGEPTAADLAAWYDYFYSMAGP